MIARAQSRLAEEESELMIDMTHFDATKYEELA
jgi:hypothetical protein